MCPSAAGFPPHGMVCIVRVADTWREMWRAGEATMLR
jgi:hypothetical protein